MGNKAGVRTSGTNLTRQVCKGNDIYTAQRLTERSTLKYSEAWLEQRCSQPASTDQSTNAIVCMHV